MRDEESRIVAFYMLFYWKLPQGLLFCSEQEKAVPKHRFFRSYQS